MPTHTSEIQIINAVGPDAINKTNKFLILSSPLAILLASTLSISLQSCSVLSTDIIKQADISEWSSGQGSQVKEIEDGKQYYLPTGRLNLKIQINKNGESTISHSVSYGPDPRYLCVLKYTDNWLSSDKVDVTINTNGLLQSVAFTTEDKTPEIISNLAETAANVIKLSAMVAGGEPEIEYQLDETIDPTNSKQIDSINKKIKEYGLNIEMSPDGWNIAQNSNNNFSSGSIDGVLYKQRLPYLFKVTSSGSGSSPIKLRKGDFQAQIYLPNNAPVQMLAASRAAFVKKENTAIFDNGSLISGSMTKGSQALGFSTIPLTLSQKALAIPEQLLTIRTKNMDEALKEKTRPLEDQKSILEKQTSLQEAIKTNEAATNKELLRLNAEVVRLQADTANKEAQIKNKKAGAELACTDEPKPAGCP